MLNKTYIKNIGSTQTIIGNRCGTHREELNWGANYDGNTADIRLNTNSNGKKHKYHFTLDNDDLANMLNVDNVPMPIHQRLKADFNRPAFRLDPSIYRIQLPTPELLPRAPSYESYPELELSSPSSFLSSPSSDEEFIVPVTLTPTRRRYKKSHRTHRVFKRVKTPSSRRSSRRR